MSSSSLSSNRKRPGAAVAVVANAEHNDNNMKNDNIANEEETKEQVVAANSDLPTTATTRATGRRRQQQEQQQKQQQRHRSTNGGGSKRVVVPLADDADQVLGPCRQLRDILRRTKQQQQINDDDDSNSNNTKQQQHANNDGGNQDQQLVVLLTDQENGDHGGVAAATTTATTATRSGILPEGVPSSGIIEVAELSAPQVLDGMEMVALNIADQVMSKKGFSMEIPSRASTNQIYIKEWDRIVLGNKRSSRTFLNVKEARKSAITLRVLQLLHTVLMKRIHITKRDLFYTDVKLFVDQAESDGVLDDVATMIGCTRSNLHVVASDKGLVVGRIQFEEDGDPIDCTRMGVGGKAIPPYIDKIENIISDAEFILLVEKEAAYMRLAEDRFYHRYPCIIITAKGQPDVATRMFLSRLTAELAIPVLGLVDSDPYGLKILSVYMSGSKNMSYDSASLTTPNIKWLGLRPSDLNKYDLPDQCRLDMTDNDIKTGKELMKEDFITKNPEWLRELEIMVKTKQKAEIQALSSFGFQYISEQYLPRKLREGDWI